MMKILKPKCPLGHFKQCPEKPYNVREMYPDGNIKYQDESGCIFWHIENAKNNKGEFFHQAMCVELWRTIQMRSLIQLAEGGNIMTSTIRNGLFYEDEKHNIIKKTDQNLIALIQIISHNQDVLNNTIETFKQLANNKLMLEDKKNDNNISKSDTLIE